MAIPSNWRRRASSPVSEREQNMTDILIVEDNEELAVLLRDFLKAEGYQTVVCQSGEEALAFYERHGARLLLLDLMLPGLDGFSVCRKIRENSFIPILIVSARTEKEDKLNGLLLGADDYIEKPYDIDILLAKIDGIFKRRYAKDVITAGTLSLDKVNRTVSKDGVCLDLRAKEFELLLLFMENRGKVLNKEFIFNRVWGFDSFSEPQTLTVHIQWLRQKIEEDPKKPSHLITVWGVGYRFE